MEREGGGGGVFDKHKQDLRWRGGEALVFLLVSSPSSLRRQCQSRAASQWAPRLTCGPFSVSFAPAGVVAFSALWHGFAMGWDIGIMGWAQNGGRGRQFLINFFPHAQFAGDGRGSLPLRTVCCVGTAPPALLPCLYRTAR